VAVIVIGLGTVVSRRLSRWYVGTIMFVTLSIIVSGVGENYRALAAYGVTVITVDAVVGGHAELAVPCACNLTADHRFGNASAQCSWRYWRSTNGKCATWW